MVIAPIVIIAVVGTIALLINLIADNAVTNAENSASAEVQSALNEIQNSLSSAQAFRVAPGSSFTAPPTVTISDSTQGTQYQNLAPNSTDPFRRMYIIGETYDQIADGTNLSPAFIADQPNSCSSANRVSNKILPNNTVYFAKNQNASKTTLYRRVLHATTSPTATICGGTPLTIRSCEATNNTTACDQDDVIATDVVKFQPTYYLANGDAIAPLSLTAATIANATAVKIELVIKRSIGGKDITYRGSTRFDLLNQ